MFPGLAAYHTMQTSRRHVFWNHVAIVRGKLAVRCRCFRRWARLPAFAKARKEKMRLAYRHAYLCAVKLMFSQWAEYVSQAHSAQKKLVDEKFSEHSPVLSADAERLASKAMLGRALLKLQRYTAHRAVRAEEYRLARRQWYVPFESFVPQNRSQRRRRKRT